MELHETSTCVEPCIHNPLIYRPTKAPTVLTVSRPARTEHTKSPHLFKLTLKDADGTAPTRPATAAPHGARSLHDPPMGGSPERGKTRRSRYNDKTRRPASRFYSASTPVDHQDGPDPVIHHWRTPKAEDAGSWMGRPGQESSRPSLVAPRSLKNRRAARGPLTGV